MGALVQRDALRVLRVGLGDEGPPRVGLGEDCGRSRIDVVRDAIYWFNAMFNENDEEWEKGGNTYQTIQ